MDEMYIDFMFSYIIHGASVVLELCADVEQNEFSFL